MVDLTVSITLDSLRQTVKNTFPLRETASRASGGNWNDFLGLIAWNLNGGKTRYLKGSLFRRKLRNKRDLPSNIRSK